MGEQLFHQGVLCGIKCISNVLIGDILYLEFFCFRLVGNPCNKKRDMIKFWPSTLLRNKVGMMIKTKQTMA